MASIEQVNNFLASVYHQDYLMDATNERQALQNYVAKCPPDYVHDIGSSLIRYLSGKPTEARIKAELGKHVYFDPATKEPPLAWSNWLAAIAEVTRDRVEMSKRKDSK